jgi:hypothetical protein
LGGGLGEGHQISVCEDGHRLAVQNFSCIISRGVSILFITRLNKGSEFSLKCGVFIFRNRTEKLDSFLLKSSELPLSNGLLQPG